MQRTSPGHGVWVRCPPPPAALMSWERHREGQWRFIGHLQISETTDQRHHRELQSPGGTQKARRMIISQPVSYQFYLILSSWTKFGECRKYLIMQHLKSSLPQVTKSLWVQNTELHKSGGGQEPTEENQPGEIPPAPLNRWEVQMERRCEHVATRSLSCFTLL